MHLEFAQFSLFHQQRMQPVLHLKKMDQLHPKPYRLWQICELQQLLVWGHRLYQILLHVIFFPFIPPVEFISLTAISTAISVVLFIVE